MSLDVRALPLPSRQAAPHALRAEAAETRAQSGHVTAVGTAGGTAAKLRAGRRRTSACGRVASCSRSLTGSRRTPRSAARQIKEALDFQNTKKCDGFMCSDDHCKIRRARSDGQAHAMSRYCFRLIRGLRLHQTRQLRSYVALRAPKNPSRLGRRLTSGLREEHGQRGHLRVRLNHGLLLPDSFGQFRGVDIELA